MNSQLHPRLRVLSLQEVKRNTENAKLLINAVMMSKRVSSSFYHRIKYNSYLDFLCKVKCQEGNNKNKQMLMKEDVK